MPPAFALSQDQTLKFIPSPNKSSKISRQINSAVSSSQLRSSTKRKPSSHIAHASQIPQLTPKNFRTHSFKAFLIKRIHQKRSRSNQICKPDQPSPTNQTKITIQKTTQIRPKPNPASNPNSASTTQTKAQAANTKTPPTYPFPAYKIVKEQNLSAASPRNIKGTVSGTLHAAGQIWRGARSTPH